MKSKVTLVSSFICNVNSRKDRTIEKYIEYGKALLQTKIPKIIFNVILKIFIYVYSIYDKKFNLKSDDENKTEN